MLTLRALVDAVMGFQAPKTKPLLPAPRPNLPAEKRVVATVYVSGRYSAKEHLDVLGNVLEASRWALDLARLGFAPLCPHSNLLDAQGLDYEDILAVDFALMRECDAIFMMPGWEASPGAIRELDLASQLKIPAFFHLEDLCRDLAMDRQETAWAKAQRGTAA